MPNVSQFFGFVLFVVALSLLAVLAAALIVTTTLAATGLGGSDLFELVTHSVTPRL